MGGLSLKKVVILTLDGLEECEALVCHDLLYRAGLDVYLAGNTQYVTSSRKVTFKTDLLIQDIKDELFDCLVLPGGIPGTYNLEKDENVQEMIDNHLKNDKYIAAICAAPSILIHKGLLKDNSFACSKGFEENLKRKDTKAVVDKKIITGCGLGGVFEFSSLIIEELVSKDNANDVLSKIGY